jgi:hypothetical protein
LSDRKRQPYRFEQCHHQPIPAHHEALVTSTHRLRPPGPTIELAIELTIGLSGVHAVASPFIRWLIPEISATQRRRSACSMFKIASGDQ